MAGAGDPYSATADLLSGLYASHEQRKAQSKAASLNSRERAAAFAYLQQTRSRDALFGGLERSQLLAGQKAELGGFAGAQTALGLGAQQARQTVGAQGKIDLANEEQSAVSRGLLGTSTGIQGIQGVGDQTTAHLAAIDQGLAQQLSELGLQKATLQGQQGRELTGLAGRNRDIEREFGYELASLAPPTAKHHKKKGFFRHGIGRASLALSTLGASELAQ